MIHNILDNEGNVKGEIELPDSLSEQEVQKILESYKYVPPAPEEPRLPPVSPRQIRLQLLILGHNDNSILAAIDSLPNEEDREPARIAYIYATEFDRYDPLVAGIGAILGFTEEQLDDIWKAASLL